MKVFELSAWPVKHAGVEERLKSPPYSLPRTFDEFLKMWCSQEPMLRDMPHDLQIAGGGLT